jgi:hypothetical protein
MKIFNGVFLFLCWGNFVGAPLAGALDNAIVKKSRAGIAVGAPLAGALNNAIVKNNRAGASPAPTLTNIIKIIIMFPGHGNEIRSGNPSSAFHQIKRI